MTWLGWSITIIVSNCDFEPSHEYMTLFNYQHMKCRVELEMLRRAGLTLLVFAVSFNLGLSQKLEYGFPSQAWHKGDLTLNDGTNLDGLIKYDLESDAVHLNIDGNTRTYVANQVEKFKIYQRDVKRLRDFITIPFETKAGYKRPKFFEIVYQNETSLLAREINSYSNQTKVNSLATHGVGRLHRVRVGVVNYDYYLVDQQGNLKSVGKGVRGVLRAFDSHQEELKSYIRSNKLKVKEKEDMVKLVTHYNNLD